MSLKAVQVLTVSDRTIARIQDNIAAFLAQLIGVEVLDGVVIEDATLAAGATPIEHLLGRVPSRMIVTSQSGAAAIWWDRTVATTTAKSAVIHSSAAIVADLYFFGG